MEVKSGNQDVIYFAIICKLCAVDSKMCKEKLCTDDTKMYTDGLPECKVCGHTPTAHNQCPHGVPTCTSGLVALVVWKDLGPVLVDRPHKPHCSTHIPNAAHMHQTRARVDA